MDEVERMAPKAIGKGRGHHNRVPADMAGLHRRSAERKHHVRPKAAIHGMRRAAREASQQ